MAGDPLNAAAEPSARRGIDGNHVVRTAVCYLALAAMVVVAYAVLRPLLRDSPLYLWIRHHIYYPSLERVGAVFSSPILYAGLVAVLLLERLIPAKQNQPLFSVGFAQDSVWLVFQTAFEATFVVAYASFLRALYNEHLGMLTIESIQALPRAIVVVLGILFSDFLAWLNHRLVHKVPAFWQFHAVHHSQRELNVFTDLRYHVVEYIISRTVKTIPLMMFGVGHYGITLFIVSHTWFTRLCHGNIRSNFGVLRYVFVTPQSHRVHHSIEERHWNKNFGVVFSVWDRLFGTHYTTDGEYPDTGIDDDRFPLERSIDGLNLLVTPVRQHVYPFRTVFGWLARK